MRAFKLIAILNMDLGGLTQGELSPIINSHGCLQTNALWLFMATLANYFSKNSFFGKALYALGKAF